jgi:hypothetical protein
MALLSGRAGGSVFGRAGGSVFGRATGSPLHDRFHLSSVGSQRPGRPYSALAVRCSLLAAPIVTFFHCAGTMNNNQHSQHHSLGGFP